ncbi:TPA: hypothetical protein ACPY0D_002098 [Citrobacter amalonaticus]
MTGMRRLRTLPGRFN